MRAVVQRVKSAEVIIDEKSYQSIQKGYLIYLGVRKTDTPIIAEQMADKIHLLRIFEDDDQKMNLNLESVSGEILLISQFTLYGNTKGNNRPSFIEAARPNEAIPLYEAVIDRLRKHHVVKTGIFGADMDVHSINDGPVTIEIEID